MWENHIIGQAKTMSSLVNSIESDTLSHALIIEGPSGYGGLPVALAVAQNLLCSADGQKPCGACKSCQQVDNLIHPDLHFAFPVVGKESGKRMNITSKDFVSNWRSAILDNPYITYNEWIRLIAKNTSNGDINVKECNEIIQQLNMQAFSGDKKVQIIWIADRLGSNGNKLLKLIEEPPEGTFIILICDDLSTILQTVTSRCRTIRLPRIEEQDISSALVKYQSLDEDLAQQIAYICDGDFNLALEYAQLDQSNLMDLCIEWLELCHAFDLLRLRQWSTEFSKHNMEEQKAILNYSLKVLQSVLYHQIMGPEGIRLSASDKTRLLRSSSVLNLSHEDIDEISKKISRMIMLIERYVTSRMVMFEASMSIGRIFKKSLKQSA